MTQASLFDPTGPSPLKAAVGWVEFAPLGDFVTVLGSIAVALVGFRMLTGHFAVRLGLRTLIGLFVALGAPLIASSFLFPFVQSQSLPIVAQTAGEERPRKLEPANADPYAGASLRRD